MIKVPTAGADHSEPSDREPYGGERVHMVGVKKPQRSEKAHASKGVHEDEGAHRGKGVHHIYKLKFFSYACMAELTFSKYCLSLPI